MTCVRCRASSAAESQNLLHPLSALSSAIERLRASLPGRGERFDDVRRETVELAAGDVVRAIVHVRRVARELERAGIAALDEAALALGRARRGVLGSVLG